MNSSYKDLIIQLRHELHAHPELSLHEEWTKQHLMEFLRKNTNLILEDRGHWFYAFYDAGSSELPPIAFRADMDAIPINETMPLSYASCIPDISHKCGHDGHSSILAGLALEISRYGAVRDVYFIFQHAEEIGYGGFECANLIEEKGIREIYACHNMSGFSKGNIVLKEGCMWCASKGISARFEGRASHASLPENGHNPALCVSKIIEFINEYPFEKYSGMVLSTVVGVRVGNSDFGVSPGDGMLSVTLRGEHESEMLDFERILKEKINFLANLEKLKVSFEESDIFPETVNSSYCAEKVRQKAEKLKMKVIELDRPIRSSEDFGYYAKKCASAIFLIGNGENYPSIHTESFDFRDELLEPVVDLFKELTI